MDGEMQNKMENEHIFLALGYVASQRNIEKIELAKLYLPFLQAQRKYEKRIDFPRLNILEANRKVDVILFEFSRKGLGKLEKGVFTFNSQAIETPNETAREIARYILDEYEQLCNSCQSSSANAE